MPLIGSWYRITKEEAGKYRGGISAIKKALTIIPFVFGEDNPTPMRLYKESSTHLFLPFYFGLSNFGRCSSIQTKPKTPVTPYTKFPDPNHPKAPKNQRAFFDSVLLAVVNHGIFSAQAQTGAGKTATVLNTIAKMQTEALVVIPTDALIRQWKRAINQHLGLSEDQVGHIQQDLCVYKGKHITVASMQSLQSRQYEPELYKYFGVIAFDEGHKISAQQMHLVLGKFYASVQFMVSAKFKRKDGRDKVTYAWFGKPAVIANGMNPVDIKVVTVTMRHPRPSAARDRGTLLSSLAKITERNRLLSAMMFADYTKGGVILAISDNVIQLQQHYKAMVDRGVPKSQLALFVGDYYSGNNKATFSRNKGISVELFKPYVSELERLYKVKVKASSAYFSVIGRIGKPEVQSICTFLSEKTKIPLGKLISTISIKQEKIKMDKSYVDDVLQDKGIRFYFATNGVMEMGVDVPWIDTGYDLTPRSDPEQQLGRARRIYPGKTLARWVSTVDVNYSTEIDKITKARIREYNKLHGCTVIKGPYYDLKY